MSGRSGITPGVRARTEERILQHARKIIPEKASQIRLRFSGQFCYIDAQEPQYDQLTHLCRIRYAGSLDRWMLAFFKYSSEKYERSFFASGSFVGTPEEALEIGVLYL